MVKKNPARLAPRAERRETARKMRKLVGSSAQFTSYWRSFQTIITVGKKINGTGAVKTR